MVYIKGANIPFKSILIIYDVRVKNADYPSYL